MVQLNNLKPIRGCDCKIYHLERQGCRSGSAWILINFTAWVQEEKNTKNARKLVVMEILLKEMKKIWTSSMVLTYSNLFCLFQLFIRFFLILLSWIRIRIRINKNSWIRIRKELMRILSPVKDFQ